MSLLKWSMILFYWIWLDIRNAHDNRKHHDWRLFIQILINTSVILLIIMEDRQSFLDMVSNLRNFSGVMIQSIKDFIQYFHR